MDVQITALGLTALGLAVIGCFSLPTLLGLWLAKSRLHWVLQALLILAIASPLILIRAFDLMLIVLVNAFSVRIFSKLRHWWQQRESAPSDDPAQRAWLQLGLQDVLAAFALLAVVAAMLAEAAKAHVWTGDASSFSLGVLQCLAIGVAAAIWGISLLALRVLKFKFWLPWVAVLSASSVAAGWNLFAAKKFFQSWTFISTGEFFSFLSAPAVTRTGSVIGWSILFAFHASAVALIVWLCHSRAKRELNTKPSSLSANSRNWLSLGKKTLGSVLLLLLLASTGYYFYQLMPPPAYSPIRKSVTGEPNSFPSLIEAGKTISTTAIANSWPPENIGPALAKKIQAQSKLFKVVELSLQAPNCFSVDWDSTQFDFGKINDDGSSLRAISRALSTRSLQSLSEGRHDDVVADGLLSLKLAERVAINGSYILSLVGTACEGIGITATGSGIEGASVEQLNKAANQIDETIAVFGPLDAEMERLIVADKSFMSNDQSIHWLDFLIFLCMDDSSVADSIRSSLVRRNVLRNLLRTEIAIRLYQSKFGRPPNSLKDLVPNFLTRVPNDGYATLEEQPFHYRVSENRQSYQLYSVGGDGDDDGGETSWTYMDEGDLDLKIICGNRLEENAREVAEYEAEQAKNAREQQELEELDEMSDEEYEAYEAEMFKELTEEFNDEE